MDVSVEVIVVSEGTPSDNNPQTHTTLADPSSIPLDGLVYLCTDMLCYGNANGLISHYIH